MSLAVGVCSQKAKSEGFTRRIPPKGNMDVSPKLYGNPFSSLVVDISLKATNVNSMVV